MVLALMNKTRPQGFNALIFATLSIWAFCSCSGPALTGKNQARESLYDRIMRSGKIRCAYGVYSPGCMKDLNTGKLSGIGVEVMELAAKKLGLAIDWTEEVAWGTMIEGLGTNRYDIIILPIWPHASRAKVAAFSRPLYYSPLFAYVQSGRREIAGSNLSRFNSPAYTIATLDGATAQVIANEDFPKARQFSLPQQADVAQLLLAVSSGKADLTFTEPADVQRFLKYNPHTLQPVSLVKPVRVFANCWMFRRGENEFKAMLDTVLDEVINSGAMEKIIAKYEPTPNSLYRVAPPYQLSAAKMQAHRSCVAGK
jgi:ABC-type amino acid transport substrate-binding protein